MSSLNLTFVSESVTLSRATNTNHPRRRPQFPLSYTAAGTPNRRGTAYEPKHVWQCSFLVDAAQRLTLLNMWDAACQSPGPVLIHDLITPYSEPVPRSRAIVPGASEASRSGGTRTQYFAQFYGEFQQEPSFEDLGSCWYVASFILTETEVVSP